jgi:hypothetical protein
MFEYGEMLTVGVVELNDFVALGPTNGTNEEGAEERPGGREKLANVTLVALLVGLEPAATGSGGFGNANDSEGEKGRTDMGVSSGFVLFRSGTIIYCEWSEPTLPMECLFSLKLLLLFPSRLMTKVGREALPRPISAIGAGKGGITYVGGVDSE